MIEEKKGLYILLYEGNRCKGAPSLPCACLVCAGAERAAALVVVVNNITNVERVGLAGTGLCVLARLGGRSIGQ